MNSANRPKVKSDKGVFFLAAGLSLFLGLFLSASIPVQANEASFSFFYLNPCASCDEPEELTSVIREEILPDKQKMPYSISYFNIFQENNNAIYESTLERLDLKREEAPVPLLVLGDHFLSGYDQIREGISIMLLSHYSETALSEQEAVKPGEAEPGEAEPGESGSEVLEREESGAGESGLEKSPDHKVVIEKPESEIWLFTTNSCKDCEKVKKELKKTGSSLEVIEKNILEEGHYNRLRELFEYYQVPSEEQKVPVLFTDTGYLSGEAQIIRFLHDEIDPGKRQEGDSPAAENNLPKQNGFAEKDAGFSGFWKMAGIGLVNGLNPCALSMLFFLLSLLTGSGRPILGAGLSYLAGKWLAYFGMGLGIFGFLGWSQAEWEAGISVIGIFMPVAAGILAVMNLIDFLHVRKKEFGKVKVQLPEGLRKWNHKMIRHWITFGEKGNGKVMLTVILLLSLVISAGEFFCTGQIYAASLYMMAKKEVLSLQLISQVGAYVTALCLPSLGILLFVRKTGNLISASDGLLRFIPMIKLIYSLAFFLFALFMLYAM